MKVEEKVKRYLDKIRREDKKINSFLHLNKGVLKDAREVDGKKKKGRLYGYVFGIKSNINVKGMPVSCASRVLENYIGSYDATVIEKIRKEDGVIIGMLNMDEFACGSSGETSAFGPTQNPSAFGRIPGGSSSGCAAAVAAGFCDVALGSDTGGSIRNPASHCGVIGVKPSYGTVSRYGLIDLSMSLDQIGPVGKNVKDCALVLDVISGKDERDATSFDGGKIKLGKIGNPKVGVVRVKDVNPEIQKMVDSRVFEMKKKWNVSEIKIKHIDLAVQIYYLLVYAEFFSATRRFDGRKYGKNIEDVAGEEVLRRILGGSEITKAEFEGAYYKKGLEVKDLIKEEFEKAFRKVDCIILPTVPVLPWKIGESINLKDVYASDALTIPANLAEVCAVSIPTGEVSGIPVGMQILCGKGEEDKLLSIAKEIEEQYN